MRFDAVLSRLNVTPKNIEELTELREFLGGIPEQVRARSLALALARSLARDGSVVAHAGGGLGRGGVCSPLHDVTVMSIYRYRYLIYIFISISISIYIYIAGRWGARSLARWRCDVWGTSGEGGGRRFTTTRRDDHTHIYIL